ncbi:MAG: hypothetical protein JNM20_19320 [Rhizobiales bacterium]|nr:hypothetical protein [Hyphomicrobiales bacterium]
MKLKLALAAMAAAIVTPPSGYAADVGYNAAEATYDYCLELARDEANANIGMIYIHPGLVNRDQQALAEKQEQKQRKQLAQREQRKEKCI